MPKRITQGLNSSLSSPGIYIKRIKADEQGRVLTVENEYWRFDAIALRVDQPDKER